MSARLDRAIREARSHLGTHETQRVDWSAVERGVFGRIEQAQRMEQAALASGRRPAMTALALGVAAAAAFAAAVAGIGPEPQPLDAAGPAASDVAGAITASAEDALVNGKAAPAGLSIYVGDRLETRGGPLTVDRPGKVSLIVEPGSRATVTHAGGALVLALEEGAIEARVTPVSSGEAFALDVGTSRVAVHGTHFRVAHRGERVEVDLSEGVLVIGEAPRVGSELGTVVTAPAHAEFTASSARTTLEVKHEASAVRTTSVVLRAPEPKSGSKTPPALANASRPDRGEARSTTTAVPSRGDAGVAAVRQDTPPAADPNAASVVANGVRACLAETPRAENVTIVVSTTLHLELFEDGTVRSARFDPPVAADVNACAASLIYKSRFPPTGTVAIPIGFVH